MNPRETERYVRWQGYRIAHLSFSINLFLGFAVASLAYVINFKLGAKPAPTVPLNSVIFLWAVSAALGCFATITKLLDYRYTAAKIMHGGKFNAFMTKYCSPITWGVFWCQIIAYAAGAGVFISSVIKA